MKSMEETYLDLSRKKNKQTKCLYEKKNKMACWKMRGGGEKIFGIFATRSKSKSKTIFKTSKKIPPPPPLIFQQAILHGNISFFSYTISEIEKIMISLNKPLPWISWIFDKSK